MLRVIAVFCLFFVPLQAQEPAKQLLPSDIEAAKRKKKVEDIRYEYSKKVKSRRDEFKQQDWQEVYLGNVASSFVGRQYLSMFVTAPRRQGDYGSDWFHLYFVLSDGSYHASLQDKRLYAIHDGTAVDLGSAELGEFAFGYRRIVKSYRVIVPAEKFKELATAGQVQMQFAGFEFKLNPKQQLLLEAIARRTRLIW